MRTLCMILLLTLSQYASAEAMNCRNVKDQDKLEVKIGDVADYNPKLPYLGPDDHSVKYRTLSIKGFDLDVDQILNCQ